MADYKYSYNGPEEHTARALHKDAPISTKVAIEICNYLKGRSTQKAINLLEAVLKKQLAIPYKRFTNGVGHKPGPLSSGRYPEKASQVFIDLIKLVEANASQKGLGSELQIIHILAHKASTPYHYGRQKRRKTKRSHVEIVVKELEDQKTKKKSAKLVEQKDALESKADHSVEKSDIKADHRVQKSEEASVAAKPVVRKTPKTETPKAAEKVEHSAAKSEEKGDTQ